MASIIPILDRRGSLYVSLFRLSADQILGSGAFGRRQQSRVPGDCITAATMLQKFFSPGF